MYKVLIVEDTETIRNELKIFLANYGYTVLAPEKFNDIINYIFQNEPDLVLLDINLPFVDGYHICREIRKKSSMPIIIVTSRNNEMDELMSMNLGADDFISKPYNSQILEARISSVLRRSKGSNVSNVVEYRRLKLNLSSGTITYSEKTMELSKNELKLLSFLIQNQGQIVSRDDLMDYMWSTEAFIDYNNLSVHVTRLRKKLEEIGFQETIETRRGLGYQLP